MAKRISQVVRWMGAGAFVLPLVAAAMSASPQPSQTAPDSAAATSSAEAPGSLRDTVALFAKDFDVTVVGLGHIGTEAPKWPEDDLPPGAMLRWLLKDYSYATVLRPDVTANGERLPERLYIVGENQGPADGGSAPAQAADTHKPPPSLTVWGKQPSTVVRNLATLAASTGNAANGGQPGAPGGAAAAAPIVPSGANPASSAAAMAALTRSAQSSLNALVTDLRKACQNPKGC